MEHIWFQTSSILGWLFDSTICISILILLVLAIKAVTKEKLPAWWSYGLWLLLLVRMIFPWGIESRISIFNYLPTQLENESYMPLLMDQDLSIPLSQDNIGTESVKDSAKPYFNNSITKESNNSTISLSLENALLAIWFTGVIILGTATLFKYIRFRSTIRQLPQLNNKAFIALFNECRISMGISKDIAIIVTDMIKSPALFGYFKPNLLLPPHFLETLDKDELRYVLLHELSHLKRHDIAVSLIVTVLQIVHWFNPLVWYAFHQLRVDQEAACDAYVLSRVKHTRPTDYAYTIASLLERFIQNRRLPSLVGIIENKSQIGRRIEMIISYKRITPQMKCVLITMLFIFGLMFFTSSSGKAGVKNTETVVDLNKTQSIKPMDISVSTKIATLDIPSDSVKVQKDEISTSPIEKVKDFEKKDAPVILAKVDTQKMKTLAEPVILVADNNQGALSENKTSEIKETEQTIKPSLTDQQKNDPSLDYTSQGLSHLEKNQIDDAISAFNKATETNPGNSVAHCYLGIANYRQGKVDNAINNFNKAIEISPRFTAAYQNRGYAYSSLGNYGKAISDYDKAIEIDPKDSSTYNMRGIAYFNQGKTDNAISDYDKAIELNPEFVAAYQNRGNAYQSILLLAKGIYSKEKRMIKIALSDYNKAIELNPGNANLYFWRGRLYLIKREYKKAVSDLNKVIEINPDSAIAKASRQTRNHIFPGRDSSYYTENSGVTFTPGVNNDFMGQLTKQNMER